MTGEIADSADFVWNDALSFDGGGSWAATDPGAELLNWS